MKSKFFKTLIVITLAIFLTACGSARDIVGLSKQSPDEFEVVTMPPLSLPPDYGLRVPAPRSGGIQGKSVRDGANDLILGKRPRSRSQKRSSKNMLGLVSPGEKAILDRARARNLDNSIRAELNGDNKIISGTDKKLIEKILFWQGVENPEDILDPEKESKRIKDLKSDGKSIGNARVPVIERKDWGVLNGLF